MEKPDISEALNQIDVLIEELEKLKRQIISIRDGTEFNEEFNEDLYCDTNTFFECKMSIDRIITGIIDFHICPNVKSHEIVIESRFDLDAYLDIGYSAPNLLYIERLKEILCSVYTTAIKNDSYKTIIHSLPKECPWTLEELMDHDIDIDELASRLPELN